MRILRFVQNWWRQLWRADLDLPGVIDSHKWENKIEIYRTLKAKRS